MKFERIAKMTAKLRETTPYQSIHAFVKAVKSLVHNNDSPSNTVSSNLPTKEDKSTNLSEQAKYALKIANIWAFTISKKKTTD